MLFSKSNYSTPILQLTSTLIPLGNTWEVQNSVSCCYKTIAQDFKQSVECHVFLRTMESFYINDYVNLQSSLGLIYV